MKAPLIVIDVQQMFLGYFKSGRDEYVRHVVKAVRQARKESRFVIIVEYKYEGPTDSRVRRALYGYPYKVYVTKCRDNGAPEVLEALQSNVPEAKDLLVCGINLDACVIETVKGLIKKGYRCEIIREATCNTWLGHYRPADDDFLRRVSCRKSLGPRMRKDEALKNLKMTAGSFRLTPEEMGVLRDMGLA